MFDKNQNIDHLQNICKNTLIEHLGIEFTGIGKNSVTAKMPVDNRTCQPYGILHGGASLVLAETLGGIASTLCIDTEEYCGVGIEINANHVRSVKEGWVYGTVVPVHIGTKTHLWEVRITNESGKLVCISKVTFMILKK